jgi:hypothetical protein
MPWRLLITENEMLGKSPTLAKTARMGHPNSKAKFKGKKYCESAANRDFSRRRRTSAESMALAGT